MNGKTEQNSNQKAAKPNNNKKDTNNTAKNNGSTKGPTIADIAAAAKEKAKVKSGEKDIIVVEKLNKDFTVGKNEIRILKEVNVKIRPREFTVILGPSGCGKSTLLNTILGLESPTTGRVWVDGYELTDKKVDELCDYRLNKLGVVYQRPDWIKSLSVLQNTAFPLTIKGVPKKEREAKALKLLEQFDIADHAYYSPTELSGGQQQKVELARSLINDPSILVADEPTGNLDSESAEKVMEIFKKLNEEQKLNIIMVTHNIDYVRYATRTIYMKDGQILEKVSSAGL
ncbi:MAG: ABC transporter ATP-binding protein [Patescibacteria group bacterium]